MSDHNCNRNLGTSRAPVVSGQFCALQFGTDNSARTIRRGQFGVEQFGAKVCRGQFGAKYNISFIENPAFIHQYFSSISSLFQQYFLINLASISAIFSSIHSFIQIFIRRPFKKSTQGRPSPAKAIQISLKQPAKRTFIIFRQDTDFQGESIPGGGANNGECATVPSCSFSTRHQ